MDSLKMIEQQGQPEVSHAADDELGIDPAAEELLHADSSLDGQKQKQLFSIYIMRGYLRGDFELDLENDTHKIVRDILASQDKLREVPISALPLKSPPPASEA